MSTPSVTIVIPSYRRLDYLREALASARHQTYADFELIVSDDGASDDIARFTASLGDPRIRYRRNETNLGVALNNFAAFSEAQGRYIASLHDDDLWEPRFLETMIAHLEADASVSVAFCDHYLIDARGRFMPRATERNTRRFRRHLLAPGRHQPFLQPVAVDLIIPMAMGAVFRRSILHHAEFPRRIGGSYDLWLAWLAVRNGQAVYYVPERLTRYRIHRDSGTASGNLRVMRDAIYVRRKLLRDERLAGCRAGLRNGLGVLYGKIALHHLFRSSSRRGRIFLKEAFNLLNRPKNQVALAVKALFTPLARWWF